MNTKTLRRYIDRFHISATCLVCQILCITIMSISCESFSNDQIRRGRPNTVIDDVDSRAMGLGGDDERLRPKATRHFQYGNTDISFTGAATLLDFSFENNLSFRENDAVDQFRFRPLVDLNTIFDFPKGYSLFTEFRLRDSIKLQDDTQPSNFFELQVREFFLTAPILETIPIDLTLGRQQFFDLRRWYFTDRMDAARLSTKSGPFDLFTAISTPVLVTNHSLQIFDNIAIKKEQMDILFNLDYALTERSFISGYLILGNKHQDRIEPGLLRNENPMWSGIRFIGDEKFKLASSESEFLSNLLKPRIQYWLDAAFVSGSADSKKISGLGIDLGVTAIARKFQAKPYVTFGYAYGSGDSNSENDTDHNFRQTGFQANSGRFGGVVNFDYYGVLYNPELRNMHILTAALGIRPTERSSIELVYHRYAQDHAFARLPRDLRDGPITFSRNPDGIHSHLGDELDLVLGYRGINNVRLRSRTGYFLPGAAYGEQRGSAFFTRLDVQFFF